MSLGAAILVRARPPGSGRRAERGTSAGRSPCPREAPPGHACALRRSPGRGEGGGTGGHCAGRDDAVRRRTARGLLLVAVALLLAVAHQVRPAAYGDRLVLPARGEHAQGTPLPSRPPLRTAGATVEAYDAATGRARWTYVRQGHRPLAMLRARGDAIALWDDGLVTDTTRRDGSAVRRHRALPGTARRLADHEGTGVLRLLREGMLAVITPERVAAYRLADGDLRWIVPTRPGCRFVPARAVRHGAVLLIARPCPAEERWAAGLVAVDDLGVVTPHRAPPVDGRRGERHSAEPPRPGKVVAPPR
ncbi:hypothetical protein [Streptomyces sp. NPDC088358]|uniref:hypothetical protein n=1 Tax=Streptomyces sp. NPDC088358 TaxID=3365857 RepID=UPI00380F1302